MLSDTSRYFLGLNFYLNMSGGMGITLGSQFAVRRSAFAESRRVPREALIAPVAQQGCALFEIIPAWAFILYNFKLQHCAVTNEFPTRPQRARGLRLAVGAMVRMPCPASRTVLQPIGDNQAPSNPIIRWRFMVCA